MTIFSTGTPVAGWASLMVAVLVLGDQPVLTQAMASGRIDAAYLGYTFSTLLKEKEGGVDTAAAERLVSLGKRMRALADSGLENPPGTRLLVHAALLIKNGLEAKAACEAAIVRAVTDDADDHKALMDLVTAVF